MPDLLPPSLRTRHAPYVWAMFAVLTFALGLWRVVRGDYGLVFLHAFFLLLWISWTVQAVRRVRRWRQEHGGPDAPR